MSVICEAFSTLLAPIPSVDAVAIMPEYFYDSYGAAQGLVRMPIVDPLPKVTAHSAWRADAPLTSPAGHLLDALEQEARDVRWCKVPGV